MEHCKLYQSHVLFPENQNLVIEGPVPPSSCPSSIFIPASMLFAVRQSSMKR